MKGTNRLTLHKRTNLIGLAFVSPGIIGFLLFFLAPMIYSLCIGFTDWNMKTTANFIGFQNYRTIFHDPVAIKSIQVTFYYTVLAVPVCNIFALLLAMLLNAKVKGTSIFRTIIYIPSVVPAVAAAAIWMFLFNPFSGFLNSILMSLRLPTQMWIYSPTQVIPCMVAIAAWSSGGTAVIYLAALQGVPRQLYEAIEIDGGRNISKFFHVTLPLISPVILYNVIMAMIGSLQSFTNSYIMTNGGPNNASLFYVLLLYRRAFESSQMGMASAMAWLLFIVTGLLTALSFAVSNKWVYYGGA